MNNNKLKILQLKLTQLVKMLEVMTISDFANEIYLKKSIKTEVGEDRDTSYVKLAKSSLEILEEILKNSK